MAKLLKLRRGTTTQHSSFTGAEGEVTVDTDKETLVVHDGSTAGGHPVAAEDLANVSSSTIAGRLSNDSIAVSKIAAGTLPSDVKIQDANVSGNLTIARADIVDGEVINSKLDSNSVTTAKINNSAVTTAKIANDAVTNAKIADNSIDSEHYVDGSIDEVHIATGAVTENKIGSLAVVSTKLAADAVTDAKLSDHASNNSLRAVGTNHIKDNAVTTGKLQTIITDTFLGRTTSGTGNVEVLSAASARGILNVENGATADQTASEILTLIKTVDGAGSGLDADVLDGLSSGSFVRSDTNDQLAGQIDFQNTGNYPVVIGNASGDANAKLLIRGANSPYIRFRENNVDKAYIQWNQDGHLELYNEETARSIRIKSGTSAFVANIGGTEHALWHGGNDGAGSGLDADLLDGAQPSTSASNNTIVQRNASGYVFANYFNTSPNDVTSGISKVCVETGNDGYIRHGTAGAVRDFLNVENGATADQSASEIASALNGQNVYTTARIGYDSNDYFQFTNNNRLDLYIAGNNEFRFESDGDFHADGDVYAYSSTTASDENLKKDVVTVADAVTKVEALKGVTFKWKKNDVESAGVIAQDVEKVLPQVVKTVADTDGTEFKAVNYGGLTSLLIEAVKNLSARIKVLEAK